MVKLYCVKILLDERKSQTMSKNIRTPAVIIYLKPFLTSGILKNAINSLKIFVLLMNCYPYHKDLRLQECLQAKTYLEIAEKTGLQRYHQPCNRSLNYGNDGYDMVFARMKLQFK